MLHLKHNPITEWWILCLVLFLGGCSITPVPITADEFRAQAMQDQAALTENQEPVTGPISLYEAMARALKYNLDFQLEIREKVFAQRQLEISRYDLLPELVTNLGFNSRNNFSGASSRSLLTGLESLAVSTSSDRDIATADLQLSWNVLDFGLSYVRAQQAADRVLIAEEQKRKVINRIIQDVRAAYWRAVSNEKLKQELEELAQKVSEALEESREVESRKLDRPLTALTYQRELISIKQELGELQRDLSLAKVQLAALMNLRPGEDYSLVIPEDKEPAPIDIPPQRIEQLALENRSELREVSYEKRINAKEAKAAVLDLLPGLDLNFGGNYSSNSFLFENNWLAYGAQISWNLLNVLRLPARQRNIEARSEVLDAERLALSMAVLTQVHVGLAQYQHASREMEIAREYRATQKKILDLIIASSRAESVSEQAVIREEMNMLVAKVKHDIARGDLENAYAGIYAAVGINPLPTKVEDVSVKDLEKSLKEHFRTLSSIDDARLTLHVFEKSLEEHLRTLSANTRETLLRIE